MATSRSTWLMMVEIAVPPASASIPTDPSDAEIPSICALVMPTCAPAPPMRIANAMMLDSVVAMLLPRPTMVAPNRSVSPCAICVMLAYCAICVIASSAFISVAMSRSAAVPATSMSLSLRMPSCPPRPTSSLIWLVLTVLTSLISRADCLSCSYSASVASTVLRTLAKLVSASIAALTE